MNFESPENFNKKIEEKPKKEEKEAEENPYDDFFEDTEQELEKKNPEGVLEKDIEKEEKIKEIKRELGIDLEEKEDMNVKNEENEKAKREWHETLNEILTKKLKTEGERDYFLSTNNVSGFRESEKQILRTKIEKAKLYIQAQEKMETPDSDFVKEQEAIVKINQEYIEGYDDSSGFARKMFSDLQEDLNITNIYELINRYERNIKDSIEKDKYNTHTHKFDTLVGIIDIAKKEGNKDLLTSIKTRLNHLNLPYEIKEKLK